MESYLSEYEKYKQNNSVGGLSKEDLFNIGYERGVASSSEIRRANTLLREIADSLSSAYRTGKMNTDDVKSLLTKIIRYDIGLVKCEYTKKYAR